jgi:23S rRNA (cytosine1962-C5)-methyltransferase
MNNLPVVILKPTEEERILAGHPWIFDNEISGVSEELKDGGCAVIKTSAENTIGVGYFNSQSRITVRMLDILDAPAEVYTKFDSIDNLLVAKIKAAIGKRKKISHTNARRIIFSEADSLPGLVVDMYDRTMVVQVTTLGMENLKNKVVEILKEELKPGIIYEKSLSPARIKEGMKLYEGVIFPAGAVLEPAVIEENGLKFYVDFKEGSKTGFYLDLRGARHKVERFAKNARVLDVFCYTGAFTAFALKAGASYVKGIDISESALETAKENMKLNGLSGFTFVNGDSFDLLKKAGDAGERYNLIILDPPPFSKSKEERLGALRGYRELTVSALNILLPEGVIFLFSCSQNISLKDLSRLSREAAETAGTTIEILDQMYQAADHPFVKEIPETLYLKGIAIRKKQ